MGFLNYFKIIDFVFLALLIRIIYASVIHGPNRELFKLAGQLIAGMLGFHFYPSLSARMTDTFGFLNPNWADPLAFLAIWGLVALSFFVLGVVVAPLIKKEPITSGQKYIAMVIGGARFAFVASVVLFFLYLSSFDRQTLNDSFSFRVLKNAGPQIYVFVADGAKAFNKNAKMNQEVLLYYETQKLVSGDSQEGD